MSDKKRIDEGYQPKPIIQKPDSLIVTGIRKPDGFIVTGGYQPATSQGDNPANKPPLKKP